MHGFARIARGENALHVVVRRGTGQAGQHALEKHQAEDDAEHFVAVRFDGVVDLVENARPVESSFQPKNGFSQPAGMAC